MKTTHNLGPLTDSIPNPPMHPQIIQLHKDLLISSDSDSVDNDLTALSRKLENDLICSKMTRETNTDSSSIKMVDKATNTEPLSPDEILETEKGLSLLSFNKNLKIFVDTLSSDIVYGKPKLDKGSSPSIQIGLLSAQPSTNRGSQLEMKPPWTPHPPPYPTPNFTVPLNPSLQGSCHWYTKTHKPLILDTHHSPRNKLSPFVFFINL